MSNTGRIISGLMTSDKMKQKNYIDALLQADHKNNDIGIFTTDTK
jgi:hypothetical protein